MKTLKFGFVFSILVVLCCVPAFASDCDDCGIPIQPIGCNMHFCPSCGVESVCSFDDDGFCNVCESYEHHSFADSVCSVCGFECEHLFEEDPCDFCSCSFCGLSQSCDYVEGYCRFCGGEEGRHSYNDSGECDYCGEIDPDFDMTEDDDDDDDDDSIGSLDPSVFCEHYNEEMSSFILLYDEYGEHYYFCTVCCSYVRFSDLGLSFSHTDSCDCQAFPYTFSNFFRCPVFKSLSMGEGNDFSKVGFYGDSSDHYYCCLECFLSVPYGGFGGNPVPCSGSDCSLCSELVAVGFTHLDGLPASGSDFVSSVTTGVSSAASWAGTYADTITAHPVLFVGVLLGFLGFGVGILKRLFSR